VPDSNPSRDGPRWFTTSHWSLILRAGEEPDSASRHAREQLFTKYWYPLYAFARRRGHPHESAQDLTQGFFLHLLEKDCLKAADPNRGRFRSFLLSAFKNFLANEWNRSTALKRGGGIPALPLDGARERYEIGPNGPASPESDFDREWAVSLVSKALHDLEEEMREAGSEGRFAMLKDYLTGDSPARPYRDVGAELGLSESAVKVAVHRMRRRLGTLLRNEIAQTVSDVAMVEDELRHLMQALAG